jgi:coenzyme PQQ precursor peptide PqqA
MWPQVLLPATVVFTHRDTFSRSFTMIWQTPQAVDVRLGFEITMYISNR